MLQIYPISDAALKWLEIIFAERFGYSWNLIRFNKTLKLQVNGFNGSIIFDSLEDKLCQANSDQPCLWWNAKSEGWKSVLGKEIPVIGKEKLPSPLIEMIGSSYTIHYDIPGLTYWMLSRLEEIGRTDLDVHDRFPASSSNAYKKKYLNRPVVDEWLDILSQVIKLQWPDLKLKKNEPRINVTCDVDIPFEFDSSLRKLPRIIVRDLIKRKSVTSLKRNILGSFYSVLNIHKFDNNRKGIEFIMNTNESVGRSVSFYFIPYQTDDNYDGTTNLYHPKIKSLIQEIYGRGHEIGIHPGYNTFCNSNNMASSVSLFRKFLEDSSIQQTYLGGRQHYLRWQTPFTQRLLEDNGLDYDSTLSYADHPGFRCGTCFEYQMFDAIEQKSLRLRQRPLILMESSVISNDYMGLGYTDKSLDLMIAYREACHIVGGDFNILWHNSHFINEEDKKFYQTIINR